MAFMVDYSRSKVFLKKLICQRIINIILTRLLKPLILLLPKDFHRIPVSSTVSLKLPSRTIKMLTSGDDIIATAVHWHGWQGFETDTMVAFVKLLERCNVFFDIGANTGIYTLIAAADNSNRQVFAFEPAPEIYKRLNDNIATNKLENVQTFPYAINNNTGRTTLYVPNSTAIPTSSSLIAGFREQCVEVEVKTYTLDDFVATHNKPVDLIKIDAEGTEFAILQGAKNTLEKYQPTIICEVLPGAKTGLLQEFLRDLRYSFYQCEGRKIKSVETLQGSYNNYMFTTSLKPFTNLLE